MTLFDDPKNPPYTYPPGFPEGIIKEYAMRYRLLYKIKHGIPLPPGKKLKSYFHLGLIVQTDDGLKLTEKGELFFVPQVFE